MRANELAKKIEAALIVRVDQMLAVGPESLAMIAEYSHTDANIVRRVLSYAGLSILPDEEFAKIWSREPAALKESDLNIVKNCVAPEIKLMLHASRDGMRNRGVDTKLVPFDSRDDGGYYFEAFGMVRALVVLGYGYFGSNNTGDETNLRRWFSDLENEVLVEEGFRDGTHRCSWCLDRYGKDQRRT